MPNSHLLLLKNVGNSWLCAVWQPLTSYFGAPLPFTFKNITLFAMHRHHGRRKGAQLYMFLRLSFCLCLCHRYSPPSEHAIPRSQGEKLFFWRFLHSQYPENHAVALVSEESAPKLKNSWPTPEPLYCSTVIFFIIFSLLFS